MDFYVNEDMAWLRKVVCWAVNVVLVLACAWLLAYSFCTQVPISGGPMQLVSDTDGVVPVNRLIYNVGKLERYDIVVSEREDHKKNVEWTIGLPGETVQIKGGYILIDGELPNTEDGLEQVSPAGRVGTPTRLEGNEYLLLGDNRGSSEDSRLLNIGNIKREQIQDKVWFRMPLLLKLDFIHSG